MKSQLSEADKTNIAQIVADRESGNHLLCPRSLEYKAMCNEIVLMQDIPEHMLSNRQIEIRAYMKACECPANLELYNRMYKK